MTQFSNDSPDGSVIKGQVNMFTAMIEIRFKCFGIDDIVGEDFMNLLGLEGVRRKMKYDVAVPLAEATMAKGRSLATDETQQALMEHQFKSTERRKRSARNTNSVSMSPTIY